MWGEGGVVAGGSMVWGFFSPFLAVGGLWAMSGIKSWAWERASSSGVHSAGEISSTLLVILVSTWSGIAICGCSVSVSYPLSMFCGS